MPPFNPNRDPRERAYEAAYVGFDDSPIAAAIWPSLTTVRQPFAAMAASALKALALAAHHAREGQAARAYIEPYELVERESTAPPPKHIGR